MNEKLAEVSLNRFIFVMNIFYTKNSRFSVNKDSAFMFFTFKFHNNSLLFF